MVSCLPLIKLEETHGVRVFLHCKVAGQFMSAALLSFFMAVGMLFFGMKQTATQIGQHHKHVWAAACLSTSTTCPSSLRKAVGNGFQVLQMKISRHRLWERISCAGRSCTRLSQGDLTRIKCISVLCIH